LYKVVTMNEQIKHYIESIKGYLNESKEKINLLTNENALFLTQLEDLYAEKEEWLRQKNTQDQLIDSLKSELEAIKNQESSEVSLKVGRTDEEIDELVQEIEYCISQLKK
jgi:hypothetical protein